MKNISRLKQGFILVAFAMITLTSQGGVNLYQLDSTVHEGFLFHQKNKKDYYQMEIKRLNEEKEKLENEASDKDLECCKKDLEKKIEKILKKIEKIDYLLSH